MAAYNLSPVFQDAQLDDDVLPLVGGTLTWYLAGTTTPATVYQTSTGTTHTAPIELNARGEPPAPIWLANGAAYKCVLADADAVPIRTIDNIVGVGDTSAFPSEFTAITIDSTGNGGKIWQDAAGNLAFQTNQGSGTQNNVSLSSTKTSSDKPITAPKLRIGDTTVPTLPVEVVGNGYINGALRVGDTTTPTQKLEVAGSVTVTGDVSPGGLGAVRHVLTTDRTYYVRTDGSDANTGLADTAGGAFFTIQRAIDVVSALDLRYANVTIKVGPGTYAGFTSRALATASSYYPVTIEGDTTTPSNVLISSVGTCINMTSPGFGYRLSGFKIASSGGDGVLVQSSWILLENMEYGACLNAHMNATIGGRILIGSGYTISGGGAYHMTVFSGGMIYSSGAAYTVTLTGTPAFSTAFASASTCSVISYSGFSFSGSATGTRYIAALNGVINTNGLTLPGSVAGSTSNGGQYA